MRVILDEDRASLLHGDSVDLGEVLEENSVDAIVTDPPSAIGFMGEDWDDDRGGYDGWTRWLADQLAPSYRALKPGGHAFIWALPRTSHWTARAVELAGFEIRDLHHHVLSLDESVAALLETLDDAQRRALARVLESATAAPIFYQVFGQGFPKSLTSKSADIPEWAGTALKPAVEHWILARKPLDGTVAGNYAAHGTGVLRIDDCRIGGSEDISGAGGTRRSGGIMGESTPLGGWAPIPGVGRWPAHLSLDEAGAAALDEQTSGLASHGGDIDAGGGVGFKGESKGRKRSVRKDKGGASRFYYVAKPARSEKEIGLDHLPVSTAGEATGGRADGSAGLSNPRAGAGRTGGARNVHPTVKSIELMRWLVRLITPAGGTVLDPFAGSGTTGVAALAEGCCFVGCEQGGKDNKYLPILVGRIRHALGLEPSAPPAR